MALGARLAIVFALVAATTALVVGTASYAATGSQITAEIDRFLVERAEEIDGGQRGRPERSGDRDQRNNNGNDQVTIAVSPDSEVQVLDNSGDVVSRSGLTLPVEQVDRAVAANDQQSTLRTVIVDEADYRMITWHLDGGGAVQVARSLDEAVNLLALVQTRTLAIAIIAALVAAGAGWVVAQLTTRPLRTLTEAVDEVAVTHDFTNPVDASGTDEVGRLARGFNRMLAALHVSQLQQRRLVQDAAHELRTPLTSVTANVEWLLRAPDLDPELRDQTLTAVRRELFELNDVMAEIIQLATESHEPPPMTATDLTPVAQAAVTRFQRRTGRKVTVSITPTVVVGNGDALERAIDNLLANANKYSPPGSPIGLTVGAAGVFVDDAGPGIPIEEREAIFGRFYRRTEDRAKPGSGLGLSIVASIVDQHGGVVQVSDSPLGGARVGFVLPQADE